MAGECTIKEIARQLGIAHSTVSRVINNSPAAQMVSASTRQRIMDAVVQNGYVPNINARRLSKARSNTIAIVLPGTTLAGISALGDPCLAEMMGGMETVFKARGFRMLMVFNDENFVSRREYLSLFKEKSVDGMLVWGMRGNETFWEEMSGYNVVVTNSMCLPECSLNYVGHDNFAATYEVTRRLLSAGRRRIAYIDGFKGLSISEERYAGYCRALAEAGIAPRPELELRQDGGVDEDRIEAFLTPGCDGKLAFDAVQGINDGFALTSGAVLLQLGFRIPEDVMIAGGDRIGDSYTKYRFWQFPIVSFRPACRELGITASEWVIDGVGSQKNGRRKKLIPVKILES